MKKNYLLLIFLSGFAVQGMAQGTWHTVNDAPSGGRYDDMYFTNPSTGYISQNSKVYKTRDGGVHWQLLSRLSSNSYYVRSIEFMTDKIGFAGLLYSANPLSGNLFKTNDGGKTWTLLTNMQIKSTDGICGMGHYGNRLCCVGTWSQPAWFYRTDDYGATWTKVNMSAYASGLVDCYMINKDTILISGIADDANQNRATILKSYDGGNTWTRVYLAPNNNSYCWKMFFRPSGLGIASVEFGPPIIARTTDWGNTWTTESVYDDNKSDLGGIGLLNDTLGWVCDQSGSGTWETHDSGLKWRSVPSDVKDGDRMVVLDSVKALVTGLTIYQYIYQGNGAKTEIASISPGKKIQELNIYPNPANEKLNVEATSQTNTFGIVQILDAKGSLVQQVVRQPFPQGKTSLTVNLENLPAGNYQLLWKTNEMYVAKTFLVVK
jgi:photosystem II stability/assembly factor-like uncharacterized protein